MQLGDPLAQTAKVDSREKADSLILELHGKVEKLRLCMGVSQNLLHQPLPANARLPPEFSKSVQDLIEQTQRIFIQVQAFEGSRLVFPSTKTPASTLSSQAALCFNCFARKKRPGTNGNRVPY